MLTSLSIRDVVLIDKLSLDFEEGLSVFTGETGAGKSIFLDSLSLALGARAEASLVRKGEESLAVSAGFALPEKHPARQILAENGLTLENEEALTIRRVMSRDGKGKAFINDAPVGVALLKQIGLTLVEIHGQFATHALLNPSAHQDVLDGYGGLAPLAAEVAGAYGAWQEALKTRGEREDALKRAAESEDYLRHQVAELEAVSPQENELEGLESRRFLLMNAHKIGEGLEAALNELSPHPVGPETMLNRAHKALERVFAMTEGRGKELLETLERASIDIAEAKSSVERMIREADHNPDELESLEERLFALKDLARKHRCQVDDLPRILREFQGHLETIETGEHTLDALRKAEQEAYETYKTGAENLLARRKTAAAGLDAAVMKELPPLKLERAVFKTQIESLSPENYGPGGINRTVFLASTNPGADLSPLHKVASGGELARFMLALKVNLAASSAAGTLVFDEVDTGVGGATASAVGQRLRRLGETCQVLVVTHSPQVAAVGGTHFHVAKATDGKKTVTSVTLLPSGERVEEIARMLSGATITPSAREAAKALLSA